MESEKKKSSHQLLYTIANGLILVACILGAIAYALNLQLKNEQLKFENEQLAKKPEMPISISIRKAFTGDGLVAQFNNHSDRYLSAIVQFQNPTTNQQLKYRLDLNPNEIKEIGHLEGWAG